MEGSQGRYLSVMVKVKQTKSSHNTLLQACICYTCIVMLQHIVVICYNILYVTTSHWPKQVTWQSPKARDEEVTTILMRLKEFMCMCACSVMSDSLWPYWLQPTRLLCPWDFRSKNTGVGFLFTFQRIFATQRSNLHLLHLLHCRQILHHWASGGAHKGINVAIFKDQ